MDQNDQVHFPMNGETQELSRLSPERVQYWSSRLGRIRLGVEPVEMQLEHLRKITWLILALITFLEVFFLSLFTAFRRPDIGLVLISISLVPIELMAWLDYVRLRNRVREYRAEVDQSGSQAH